LFAKDEDVESLIMFLVGYSYCALSLVEDRKAGHEVVTDQVYLIVGCKVEVSELSRVDNFLK